MNDAAGRVELHAAAFSLDFWQRAGGEDSVPLGTGTFVTCYTVNIKGELIFYAVIKLF